MEEGTGFVPILTKAGVEPKAELESGENPQPSYDVNDSLDTYDGVLQGKNDDLPTNHQVLDSEGEPPKRVRYELDKPVRNRRTDSVDLSRVILHPMSVLSKDIGKVTDVDVEDNVDVEPPQKEVKSLQFLQVLLGRSSVHAMSRVGQAQTKRKRAFWLLVLTASFFGCCYEVHDFLTVYFQYPVLIDAVMTRETPFPSFPAVTICNLNRMKKQHYDCVKKGENWQECNQIGILPQLEITMTRTLVFSERTLVTKVTNKTTPSRRKFQKEAQEFLNAYSKIDTETRKCFGYNVEELVKRCTFDWNVCTHRNFTYFYSMQYGNCYTFKNTPPDRTRHGLELDLYLDIYSYLDLTSASGIRVVVHDPDEDPNPSEDGVTISPGFETHLSMSLSSVHRLSAPYRDRCKTYDRTSNHTDQRSQFDCIRTCQQRTSFTLCGCIDPVMTSETFQMTLCDLKNGTQMTCLDEVLDDMSENGLPCDCPLPCVTTTYNLQISSSALLEDYLYSDGSFGWTRDPQCEIEYSPFPFRKKRWLTEKRSKSYAKLKVFFGTNEHTVYAQRAMFNDSEFWAHLGGNMGLWLGLSLVAAFEYVEGVGLFLGHCFKRSAVI